MTFGEALVALKAGKRVARAGWNGKGMWIALTPGSVIEAKAARSGACLHLKDNPQHPTIQIEPHIDMFTAQGTVQPGWLASQADMCAEDWSVVE